MTVELNKHTIDKIVLKPKEHSIHFYTTDGKETVMEWGVFLHDWIKMIMVDVYVEGQYTGEDDDKKEKVYY